MKTLGEVLLIITWYYTVWRSCEFFSLHGIVLESLRIMPSSIVELLMTFFQRKLWQCWVFVCCSIFRTFTTSHTPLDVLTSRRSAIRRWRWKAQDSRTSHSPFSGHSRQRYTSLVECLEPFSLDFLPIELAGKFFFEQSVLYIDFFSWHWLVALYRSRFGERSFTVAGPSAWNALPVNIRTASSVESFKLLLKTHLFEISFGS